jgi:ferredoxin
MSNLAQRETITAIARAQIVAGNAPWNGGDMRIVVDFDLCQSHGLCTEAAPELFEIRDDGFLYVLNETPGKELASKLEKAVLECPTGAITIKDE